MNEFIKQMPDEFKMPAEGLAASARSLATHAEELLHSTSTLSNESIVALRKKLGESLAVAKQQINAAQGYAVQRGRQAASAADSYAHEKPWQLIAFAGIAGLLIGFMGRSGSRAS